MTNEEKNIPQQEKGSKSDTVHSADFNTVEEAGDCFLTAKNRLLDISDWDKLSGAGTAKFELTDNSGNSVNRLAQTGDYFKIDIPGPGTITGEGKDWVQIEIIDDQSDPSSESEYMAIRVRPASNPLNKDKETAHFFRDDATSTFIVKRTGRTVSAEVHGRNEIPNTKDAGLIDTVRNAAIATGAILHISNIQWKKLVTGLIEK